MSSVKKVTTVQEFWDTFLVPDFDEFMKDAGDMRKGFHSALSQFHLHDWIFEHHGATIKSSFNYIDAVGARKPAATAGEFANALEQMDPDFGIIRGVANSIKHLALSRPQSVPDAPTNAANTVILTASFNPSAFQAGAFSASDRMMIETGTGFDKPLKDCVANVNAMWVRLRAQHGW